MLSKFFYFIIIIFIEKIFSVSVKIFCDDYCTAIYINNIDQNINLQSSGYDVSTINLNLKIGDLLTITNENEYTVMGIALEADIGSSHFSSSDERLISWNSTKGFMSQYKDFARNYHSLNADYRGYDGDPYEVRDYFFQFSDNIALKGRSYQTKRNICSAFFYIDNIIYIDSTLNKDNVVGVWEFELLSDLKYGSIYVSSDMTKVEGKVVLQNLCYKPTVSSQMEKIAFRFVNGNRKSPMTMSYVLICDDGCGFCDENNYNTAVIEQSCITCSSSNKYRYRNRCLSTCPSYLYTITEEKICVEDCDVAPYLYYYITSYSRKCVESCSSYQYLYERNNTCYSSCPSPLYKITNEKLCVDNCNVSPYLYYKDNECVSSCPSGYYLYENNNTCYKTCSFLYTIEDTKECVDDCTVSPYIYYKDNECVSSCPSDYYLYENTKTCYQSCYALYTIETTKKCVDDCTVSPYLYYENNKCVKECSSGYYKYKAKNICYQSCPNGLYSISNLLQCVDECNVSPYIYRYNNQCVSTCPNNYYLEETSKTCYSSCSALYTIEKEKLCVYDCTKSPYLYYSNNKCVSSCPSNYYLYEANNTCYSQCPDTLFKIENGKKCIEQCPSSYPYIYNNQCVSICPSNSYLYETTRTCYDSCFALYTLNNKCVDDCPSSFPYYYNKQCVSSCPQGYYLYRPTKTCYQSCNLLYTIEDTRECVDDCIAPYDKYYNNQCVSSCPSNLYLYDHICYEVCPTTFIIEDIKLCVDDCTVSPYLYYNNNQCVSQCPSNLYVNELSHTCYEKCNTKFTIESIHQCVDECTLSPFLLELDANCVEECPNRYIIESNRCVLYNQLSPVEGAWCISSNINKEELIATLYEYESDYLSINKTIVGNDYSFQIYHYDEITGYADNATSIDFSQCINTLKKYPQYKDEDDFIIVKIDINRTDELCPQTEYQILVDDIPVDLSLCKMHSIEVKYKIDPNTDLIDIELVNELAEKGIDLFNPNDPFFNDICFPYTTENNTDIPLKDRRNDFFQNVSICDTGCSYKSYDPLTYEVTCDCEIKNDFNMKSTEPTKEFFNALLDNTNLKIVKCYRLLFSLNNYINNLGFLIYGIAFVILFIFMLYFFIDFDKLLHSELYQNVKSSPSFSILIKEKPFLERERILNLSDLSSKYSEKAMLSKHSDLQEEEIDLNESPFTYAIRKEHRTIPQIFKDYFILKLDFINILFFPNKYEFLCISMSLYIFCLSLDFTINSMLFSDDVISRNYHSGGNMDYIVSFTLSVLSNVIGSIVSIIFVKLAAHSEYYNEIEDEIQNQTEYIKICKEIITSNKIRLYWYYVLEIIFFLFFWYYITIFCIVYRCSQMKWFFDCLNGIIVDIFYIAILSLCATFIRSISIFIHSKKMYYLARYLIYEL